MSSLVDHAEMQEGGDMSSAAAFQVVVFEDRKGGCGGPRIFY